jgi:hypothetical protein
MHYNKDIRDFTIQRIEELPDINNPFMSEFIRKYEKLSPEGRKKVKEYIDDLLKIYHQ